MEKFYIHKQQTTFDMPEYDIHNNAPMPNIKDKCRMDTPALREVEFAFLGVSYNKKTYKKHTL